MSFGINNNQPIAISNTDELFDAIQDVRDNAVKNFKTGSGNLSRKSITIAGIEYTISAETTLKENNPFNKLLKFFISTKKPSMSKKQKLLYTK